VFFARYEYNYNDQIKEDEMGMASSTHEEKVYGGNARRKKTTRKT
jgi:hypothetical protein